MTPDELRELFRYDETNGTLAWKSGQVLRVRGAGRDKRYLLARVNGVDYYLHRLIFAFHHGYFPEMVDHRSLDTRDNRIANLRACTNAQNQYNSRRKSNNKSGFKGVVFRRGYRHPWQARITVAGCPILIGRYDTPEQAAKAYADAAAHYAGDFARA